MQPWLVRSGYWIYATDRTTVPSHVSLSGGKMNIPPNMRSDPDSPFLLTMARDIVSKNPVHVVERTYKNGTYRMFADLDIPTDDPDPEILFGILNRAIGALPKPLQVFPIVVCTRKWRDGKVGAHLVWGNELRVNDDRALELRDGWIESLRLQRQEDFEFWKKTIDAAVYRRNGLRMPWALKKDGHPDASYVPTHVVLEGPMEPIEPPIDVEDVQEVATWLARSSISAMENNNTKSRSRRTVATKASAEASRRLLKDDTGEDDVFSLSDDHARILMDALPKAYGITSISDIGIRCKRIGERILSIFVSARSRVCAVAEREHSANHIYFELRKDGRVFQRCHSTKCGGRGMELAGVYHGLPETLFKGKCLIRTTECNNQHAAKRKKTTTSVLPSTNIDAASRASMLVSKLEERYSSSERQ